MFYPDDCGVAEPTPAVSDLVGQSLCVLTLSVLFYASAYALGNMPWGTRRSSLVE